MATAIRNLPTGGSILGTKNITLNGNYTASTDGLDGYSNVNVNVPNTYAIGDEGKVVNNGALITQNSDTVTENGTIDTTLINSLEVNVSGGGISGVLTGITAPDNNIGSDRDLYLRTYPLPSNVNFVEYLESSGTQYIDTGFTTIAGYSLWVRAFCEQGNDKHHEFMGGRTFRATYEGDYGLAIQNFNGNIVLDAGDNAVSIIRHTYALPADGVYEMETGPLKFINGIFYKGFPSSQGPIDPAKVLIFGMDNYNGYLLRASRIYRAMVKQNGVILADYLPALDGNGVPCMYEAISGVYKYNSGTGTFSYGGTVTPGEATPTIYIKQNGSWIILNQLSLN